MSNKRKLSEKFKVRPELWEINGSDALEVLSSAQNEDKRILEIYLKELGEALDIIASLFEKDKNNKSFVSFNKTLSKDNNIYDEWEGTFEQLKKAINLHSETHVSSYLKDASKVIKYLGKCFERRKAGSVFPKIDLVGNVGGSKLNHTEKLLREKYIGKRLRAVAEKKLTKHKDKNSKIDTIESEIVNIGNELNLRRSTILNIWRSFKEKNNINNNS